MATRTGIPRPITLFGEPVLHAVCPPVTSYDDDLAQLVADMFASMYEANGVGLAANQIGVAQRVFVYDVEVDGTRHVGHVVNPELTLPKGRRHLDVEAEGCLSVPGQYAELGRMDEATVTGTDMDGHAVRVTGTGMLARCLQHEVDHLNGVVYVDRLSVRRRRQVLRDAGLAS